MNKRLFSTRNRPMHLGPFPLERLKRQSAIDPNGLDDAQPVEFKSDDPSSIVNAMGEYQAMLDAIRVGFVNKEVAICPTDPTERANHLKSFAYFQDAPMVGACKLVSSAILKEPVQNPDVERLGQKLRSEQTSTLASGIDLIMADLRETMDLPNHGVNDHSHALVFLYDFPRDPKTDEPGTDWIQNAQKHRAAMRGAETAVIIANYLRLLGYQATAHSGSSRDVNLSILARNSGLIDENGQNPYVGNRFGLAAVTTNFEFAVDAALAPKDEQPRGSIKWRYGVGTKKSAKNFLGYATRRYVDGAHPFETLKRVEKPTTYIDEPNVARVPKRADLFARSLFGDMGPKLQENAKNGNYARKAAPSSAQRRPLGAFVLLQSGEVKEQAHWDCSDDQKNADHIKATSYFLGVDAVGISRCPDWAWYSHNAKGEPIVPTQENAISMIIEQGYETMEGSSGDDWIAVAQSMHAYLRFSLLGGVIAQQIRNLGYSAKAHTVLDGEVLQPPLLLLSGLGEVSRIGEVILNPFLGPRLKSGVITTDMPLAHDKPIDFGLQTFCEGCNKCARECPAGAITAGPKLMFNGYEIWKSDSQKCTTHRVTTPGGAMCGRCMKTCPWNLEGVFAERPFRSLAMKAPKLAPVLAGLDDKLGRGARNEVKKWWWDLERTEAGGYEPTKHPVNKTNLQPNLKVEYKDQTLAVYPASLAPPPWPFPFPMDREKGIEAYQAMITAEEYQKRLGTGNAPIHKYETPKDAPVLPVIVQTVTKLSNGTTLYEFVNQDGTDLPEWRAGAHIDIVVAPEFLRQYSMCGDPNDRSKYVIAVLREDEGRGGSSLLHRIFSEGRRIFISKPINHFPIDEKGDHHILMGGGIGVTPMIAFAHELAHQGQSFELHYSASTTESAAFIDILKSFDWSDRVQIYISETGNRADLKTILKYRDGAHVYTCGPDKYMASVLDTAIENGFDDENCHMEYFNVPELPPLDDYPFILRLQKTGIDVEVMQDERPTDALARKGIHVDVKCSDGICGVCKCGLIKGDVDHRDFVLSNAQRKENLILCQSRAAAKDGIVEVDL